MLDLVEPMFLGTLDQAERYMVRLPIGMSTDCLAYGGEQRGVWGLETLAIGHHGMECMEIVHTWGIELSNGGEQEALRVGSQPFGQSRGVCGVKKLRRFRRLRLSAAVGRKFWVSSATLFLPPSFIINLQQFASATA